MPTSTGFAGPKRARLLFSFRPKAQRVAKDETMLFADEHFHPERRFRINYQLATVRYAD